MSKQAKERHSEQLRQEKELFEQHKRHTARWFALKVIMGYTSIILLMAFMGIGSYILLYHKDFSASVVGWVSAALFVDILGLLVAVWKTTLNPSSITPLRAVTIATPSEDSHVMLAKETSTTSKAVTSSAPSAC